MSPGTSDTQRLATEPVCMAMGTGNGVETQVLTLQSLRSGCLRASGRAKRGPWAEVKAMFIAQVHLSGRQSVGKLSLLQPQAGPAKALAPVSSQSHPAAYPPRPPPVPKAGPTYLLVLQVGGELIALRQ